MEGPTTRNKKLQSNTRTCLMAVGLMLVGMAYVSGSHNLSRLLQKPPQHNMEEDQVQELQQQVKKLHQQLQLQKTTSSAADRQLQKQIQELQQQLQLQNETTSSTVAETSSSSATLTPTTKMLKPVATSSPTTIVPTTPSPKQELPKNIPNCALTKRAKFMATNRTYRADQPIDAEETVDIGLCYLDNHNCQRFWLGHFPHAAEPILQCWSFFQRIKEQNPNATIGFWINNDSIKSPPMIKIHRSDWSKNLLGPTEACIYDRRLPLAQFNQNQTLGFMQADGKNVLVHRLPSNGWRSPDWFLKPEDAKSLQKAVLGQAAAGELQQAHPLHIGLIQRTKSRRVTNLDEIETALQDTYPQATIQQTTMDGMDFFQQAQWWAKQHVVVAAHGAALTNLIFLPNQGGLVEIFPQYFYELQYFKSLSQSMGMPLHTQWINASVVDSEKEYQEHRDDPHLKKRDVAPPVEEILQHVQSIVKQMT